MQCRPHHRSTQTRSANLFFDSAFATGRSFQDSSCTCRRTCSKSFAAIWHHHATQLDFYKNLARVAQRLASFTNQIWTQPFLTQCCACPEPQKINSLESMAQSLQEHIIWQSYVTFYSGTFCFYVCHDEDTNTKMNNDVLFQTISTWLCNDCAKLYPMSWGPQLRNNHLLCAFTRKLERGTK